MAFSHEIRLKTPKTMKKGIRGARVPPRAPTLLSTTPTHSPPLTAPWHAAACMAGPMHSPLHTCSMFSTTPTHSLPLTAPWHTAACVATWPGGCGRAWAAWTCAPRAWWCPASASRSPALRQAPGVCAHLCRQTGKVTGCAQDITQRVRAHHMRRRQTEQDACMRACASVPVSMPAYHVGTHYHLRSERAPPQKHPACSNSIPSCARACAGTAHSRHLHT